MHDFGSETAHQMSKRLKLDSARRCPRKRIERNAKRLKLRDRDVSFVIIPYCHCWSVALTIQGL
jgi:hypothetical protein